MLTPTDVGFNKRHYNMSDLKSKVAAITGSANGLGKALATELYRQGYHLAIIDIDYSGLEKLKTELENENQKITIHNADISNEQDVISIRQQIINQHKRIDILINNAGISISQTFDQVDLTDAKQLFDINFWGTVYCSKHFLHDLKKQKDSRLVNIISNFALMGFPGKTIYGSSKSGIMGFTNSLKTELSDTSIKVCLVIPPPLDTGLVNNSKNIDDNKREKEAAFLKKNGMPLNKAARRIIKQVKKGKYRIVIGAMMFWIDTLSRFFPTTIHYLIGNNKKRFNFV